MHYVFVVQVLKIYKKNIYKYINIVFKFALKRLCIDDDDSIKQKKGDFLSNQSKYVISSGVHKGKKKYYFVSRSKSKPCLGCSKHG